MKLFFRVSNGPFVHVFQMDTRSNNSDEALKELMDGSSVKLRDGQVIERVVAYPTEKPVKPTQEELQWLQAWDLDHDVAKPERAIFDSLGGKAAQPKPEATETELIKQIRLLHGDFLIREKAGAVIISINNRVDLTICQQRSGWYDWALPGYTCHRQLENSSRVLELIDDLTKYL